MRRMDDSLHEAAFSRKFHLGQQAAWPCWSAFFCDRSSSLGLGAPAAPAAPPPCGFLARCPPASQRRLGLDRRACDFMVRVSVTATGIAPEPRGCLHVEMPPCERASMCTPVSAVRSLLSGICPGRWMRPVGGMPLPVRHATAPPQQLDQQGGSNAPTASRQLGVLQAGRQQGAAQAPVRLLPSKP
jgi:hypothetical protein